MATILVVEDDTMPVALLEDFLDQEGHRVLVARDGMEALALVGRELPDLILCDVRTPRMGGAELCLRVRSAPRTRAIPLILMSSVPPTRSRGRERRGVHRQALPTRRTRPPACRASRARAIPWHRRCGR